MNKKLLAALGVISFTVVILGGGYFYLSNSQNNGRFQESLRKTFTAKRVTHIPEATPIPTPRPIKSLPGGIQTYNIGHGPDVRGPKPTTAVINPLTPKKGEKQTVQLSITSDAEITDAKIILHTDNTLKEYSLKVVDGDTQNGTWEASWTISDSYDYNYYIQFYLKSANGLFENGLRFRQ